VNGNTEDATEPETQVAQPLKTYHYLLCATCVSGSVASSVFPFTARKASLIMRCVAVSLLSTSFRCLSQQAFRPLSSVNRSFAAASEAHAQADKVPDPVSKNDNHQRQSSSKQQWNNPTLDSMDQPSPYASDAFSSCPRQDGLQKLFF